MKRSELRYFKPKLSCFFSFLNAKQTLYLNIYRKIWLIFCLPSSLFKKCLMWPYILCINSLRFSIKHTYYFNSVSVLNMSYYSHHHCWGIKYRTVHFHFTEICHSVLIIISRVRRMSSVVVVDDISPVVRTCDVERVIYCGCCIVGVPKTQHSVLFVCCVGDVDRKSQERPTWPKIFIQRTLIKKILNVYENKRNESFKKNNVHILRPLPHKNNYS